MLLTSVTLTRVVTEAEERVQEVVAWFGSHARDLPWRSPDRTPWGVLVSEVMLQQTPVSRVQPIWLEWMTRWPTPADLATESSGEAVRAWGRLGYPRRAMRLHQCAVAIVEQHGGQVPRTHAELIALPGVGEYTAGAVLAFAYGEPALALDTNVRRVLHRLAGQSMPADHITHAERESAAAVLDTAIAMAATMELGALVCTSARPACEKCPVVERCQWRAAGYPANAPVRRSQKFEGTDRQCRGRIIGALRELPRALSRTELELVWHEPEQFGQCLDALVREGLVRREGEGFSL